MGVNLDMSSIIYLSGCFECMIVKDPSMDAATFCSNLTSQ